MHFHLRHDFGAVIHPEPISLSSGSPSFLTITRTNKCVSYRTSPNLCFLKSGAKLEDGRIFRHGSHRTRHYYEFERDPNDPRERWESWERKNCGKTRQRADSMEANVSTGEDRYVSHFAF